MQQSGKVVGGVLAGLVAAPSVFAANLLRQGQHALLWKLLPAIAIVIFLAAAIMAQRQNS